MQIPSIFRVTVLWDTDGKRVKLPKTVSFCKDVSAQMQETLNTYLQEDPETNQQDDFDNLIIKHLEDLTGWLVDEFQLL